MKRVAVYCITRDKFKLTKKSLKMLRTWAGVPLDIYVFDQASDPQMRYWLLEQQRAGYLHYVHSSKENVGQNLAANHLLDVITKQTSPPTVSLPRGFVPTQPSTIGSCVGTRTESRALETS